MKLLLKGGRLVDPSQNLDEVTDILIENGVIAGVGNDLLKAAKKETAAVETLDIKGLLVVPGLIDMHTHLREPGFEYKETIQTGSEAAAAGGFTSIACMPNTNPVNDNRSVTEFIRRQAARCGLVNVYPVASISMKMEGVDLSEFMDLKNSGAVAFSDDGKPVMDSALMRRALEYASSLGVPVISHCEDIRLSAGGAMNEGLMATELGLGGIPTIAEDIMVARDILIADYTRTTLHIAHVSTAGAVQLIREAKARGINVTAETAPHYFTLTDESVKDFDTRFKVNPPLRSAADVAAVKQGLKDGTIDAIATDHAPHSLTDKEVEFDYAAFGLTGLETSLGLALKLVDDGILSLNELVLRMSTNPARILHLQKGTLKTGSDADITVIDLKKNWVVDPQSLRSRGKNTPFYGWKMTGKAVMTIVGGEITYQDHEKHADHV
jgi:dihydroorotase